MIIASAAMRGGAGAATRTVAAVNRALPGWSPDAVERLVATTRRALELVDPIPVLNARPARMQQLLESGSLGAAQHAVDQLVAIGALRPGAVMHDTAFASLQFVRHDAPATTALAQRTLGTSRYGSEAAILDPALLARATVSPNISGSVTAATAAAATGRGARQWTDAIEAISIRVGDHLESTGRAVRELAPESDAAEVAAFLTGPQLAARPIELVVPGATTARVRAIVHEQGVNGSPAQDAMIAVADRLGVSHVARTDHALDTVVDAVRSAGIDVSAPRSRIRTTMTTR